MTIIENTDQNNPTGPGVVPGAAAPPAAAAPGVTGAGGLADMVAAAFMKHLTENQPPPVSAVIAKAKAAADAAAPVNLNNPTAPTQAAHPVSPAPGSFGDKLGGALGDAAAAQGSKEQGWLGGVANTLNARQQRLAQQAKDQALLAKTQAETVAMHRNIYQQDQAIRQAAYKGNQEFVDTYKVNHEIDSGVTHDELMKRATSDKDFAKKYYVRATGEEPVLGPDGLPKVDKSGNPITVPTYSIVNKNTTDGSPDNKVVSPDMSADMRKYLGNAIPPNTKLTSDQFAALNGQLNLVRNATNIVNNTNEKDLTDEQMKVLNPYLTDPTIQAAISHVPGSAYAGLLQYQQNADAHIKQLQGVMEQAKAANNQQAYDVAKQQVSDLTEERNKVAAFTSQAISPKQIERYNKEGEEGIKWVDKILHDPTSLAGDKASSVIPQLQEALKTETDPGRRMKLTAAVSAATAARDNYFADMDRKARAEQLAKQGSPQQAGAALANGLVTLADLKTRGTTADFILQSIDEARRLDKDYNPADEVAFEHVAKSPQMAVFFGSARSLISKGGTVDQLLDWGNKIPDNSLPVLNKVEDWMDLAKGKGPLAGYAALVLGLADDYGKVMGGGVASDRARDSALHLFAAAQTKEQRLDAARGTLGGVGSQFDSRVGKNRFLEREYSDFQRSPLSPARENSNNTPAQRQAQQQQQNPAAASTQQNPQVHPMGIQRPKDVPTATATKDFKDKQGVIRTYWTDASGKPLRAVAPGELPKE